MRVDSVHAGGVVIVLTPRRAFGLVVDTLLLVASALAVATGVLVDRLDLNEFAPHRWAGYAMTVLAGVHVALHWRTLTRFWTGRLGRVRQPRMAPAAESPTPLAPTTVDGTAARFDTRGPELAASPSSGSARTSFGRRTVLGATLLGGTGLLGGWFGRIVIEPPRYEGGDPGAFYHGASKLGLSRLATSFANWGKAPDRYREPASDVRVMLPELANPPSMTLADALGRRRSLRSYDDRAVTAAQLAWLTHAATGLTSDRGWRTAPSAGGLFPVETYVAVNRVDDIAPGLYHVDVRERSLEPVRAGSVSGDIWVAGLAQDFVREAPVVIILTAVFQRTRWKYRERSYRYVAMEAGHIGQSVHLAAEAAGLGACVVGAFLDGTLNDLLRVDGRSEAALSMITVGVRA